MVFLCYIRVCLGKNGRFRDSDGLKIFGKIPDIGKNLKNFGIFWARLPDLEKIVW